MIDGPPAGLSREWERRIEEWPVESRSGGIVVALFSENQGSRPSPVAAEHRALAWLLSLADQERGVGWNPAASPEEQWKLGRTRALLDLLGAPDRGIACVLVAGTKGKGSTCALLASLLDAAGLRVGLYTKPHLQQFRERIRLGGQMVSAAAFAAGAGRARAAVARLAEWYPEAGEPTTFEVTTALALDHFRRSECTIAILEVGLGGRLDATNAVFPALSVITSISRDHTAILGNSLAAIAREKAGILRAGVPALFAVQRPAAGRALRKAARTIGANFQFVPALATANSHQLGSISFRDSAGAIRDATLNLPGAVQRQNAALALAAAHHLAGNTVYQHAPFALERLRWPGRFEIVPGIPPIVLDGAHNDASAAQLAQTLAEVAAGRPIHLVLGVNRDKDARAVIRPLARIAASVVTISSGSVRAAEAAPLARLCRAAGASQVAASDSIPAALASARAAAADGGLVCVTGSLALVGAVRDALGLAPPRSLW